MTRAIAAVALALLLAIPMQAGAREPRGGGRGGVEHRSHRGYAGPRHGGPRHGGPRHGWHGGHGHHGHYGHFRGPRAFFYGSFGPYWYPGWGYRPYFYPYYPYYPAYPYPPSWAPYPVDDDDDDEPEQTAPPEDVDTVSYGLIRLEGIPDDAAVDLDDRFWLTARDLDDRWLALPQGEHRIAVTIGDGAPIVRTVRIAPGKTHVLTFASHDRPT